MAPQWNVDRQRNFVLVESGMKSPFNARIAEQLMQERLEDHTTSPGRFI